MVKVVYGILFLAFIVWSIQGFVNNNPDAGLGWLNAAIWLANAGLQKFFPRKDKWAKT